MLLLDSHRWVEDTYCVHWGGPHRQHCERHPDECLSDWLSSMPCNEKNCI